MSYFLIPNCESLNNSRLSPCIFLGTAPWSIAAETLGQQLPTNGWSPMSWSSCHIHRLSIDYPERITFCGWWNPGEILVKSWWNQFPSLMQGTLRPERLTLELQQLVGELLHFGSISLKKTLRSFGIANRTGSSVPQIKWGYPAYSSWIIPRITL